MSLGEHRKHRPHGAHAIIRCRRSGGVFYAQYAACLNDGGAYRIVDIATFPWTARYEWQGIALEEFPNVKRWYEIIYARPAVKRGMDTVYDELLT